MICIDLWQQTNHIYAANQHQHPNPLGLLACALPPLLHAESNYAVLRRILSTWRLNWHNTWPVEEDKRHWQLEEEDHHTFYAHLETTRLLFKIVMISIDTHHQSVSLAERDEYLDLVPASCRWYQVSCSSSLNLVFIVPNQDVTFQMFGIGEHPAATISCLHEAQGRFREAKSHATSLISTVMDVHPAKMVRALIVLARCLGV